MELADKELRKHAIHCMMRVGHKQKVIIENKLSCEKIGIFPAQHRLLMELANNREISQKELSRILHVSPATVTVCIKKLVKDGYIKKENLEDDNRYNVLAITEKGKNIIEKSALIFDAIDEKMFRDFSDEEIKQLINLLTRMHNNLEE